MKEVPNVLDKITDTVLKYRPPAKDVRLTTKAKLVEDSKKKKPTKDK